MNKINKKLPELQVASGIAILCVVLIHSNAYYLLHVLNLQSYLDANFVVRLLDNFIHGAVQMFIFIAGYKFALNNIDEDYKKYALKKINSVIKPFLLISTIFFIRHVTLNLDYFNNLNLIIIKFLDIFIGYNVAYQLWYIPMYLFITLTYPILYRVLRNDKVRLLVILGLDMVQKILCIKINWLSNHPFDFLYFYLFFEMGLIFYKYDLKNKIQKWDIKIIIIYIVCAVLLTFNPIPRLYWLVQTYLLWPLCIVAYYLLSLRLKYNKLFNYLGKYSFYIFLLHEPIICTKISDIFKHLGIFNSIISVFIVCTITIVITIMLFKIIENTFLMNVIFNKKNRNLS